MSAPLKYDHYKLLGVPSNANEGLIKRAYRRKVMKYHPDRNPDPSAAEVFSAISDAYHVLIDPVKRAAYDDRLKFYRPSSDHTRQRFQQRTRAERGKDLNEKASASFAALHVLGLVFGLLVTSRCVLGMLFEEWPIYTLLLSIPAWIVLPYAYNGLRTAIRSWN